MNKVQNNTRLMNPKRWRRKRRHARTDGETEGSTEASVCGIWTVVMGSVEFDTGIDPHVTEVADELGDQANEREQIQSAQHHGIVATHHALKT